jgi:ferric-dicitrate binding protein FerR (iron transport regulator)
MNESPTNHTCRDPFENSLDAVLSGDAGPHDRVILNDCLRIDPDARRTYIRAMAFEAMLAREFAAPDEETVTSRVQRGRWPTLAAVAATILLAAALAWHLQPGRNHPANLATNLSDGDEEITHAVITSLDDASGRFGKISLSQGLRLSEGIVELDRGLAEITFDTGAELTLEGPARLELESENQSRLDAGRASARVPEHARGFVVLTPSSYIRDLGTAFAVEVRDGRETDLHVLEGEVEVVATGRNDVNPPKILRQKEAVRLAKGTMLPIRFSSDNPGERRRKQARKIPPSVHWSFDSWDGSATTDSTRGHMLELWKKKEPARPEMIEGPFGPAIHFDGHGTFASSDYPGVAGSQARTVACWIRLQPAGPNKKSGPNGIVAWGVNHSSGKWQIAWNKAKGQGTIGAPRVEFGDGFAIGSTDLRDDRWHHLAVVYLGGPKANVASHVRIYVDGRLEALTGRRQRNIDATSGIESEKGTARPLTLGRSLDRDALFFAGDLDEVHVFEGPLLPDQINQLILQNSVRPPKP